MIGLLRKHKLDICALFVLVGIWVLFTYRLWGNEFSAHAKDNEFLLAPVLSHMSKVMLSGEWPLWMDTVLGGLPLYNLTQLSAAYPFYFTALPVYGEFFIALRSIHLITLVHLLVFVVNAFVLLRVIGVSRVAAIAGATIIVFNANTAGMTAWVNIIAPYAWLPLYLAGLIQLFKTPTSIRAVALTLVSIILITIASPAQPLIHAVLITAVLAAAHGINMLMAKQLRHLAIGYLNLLMISVIAMLLTSPVLLPAVTEFDQMLRWVGAFAPVEGNARIPFEAFLTDQLSPSSLMGVLFQSDDALLIGSQYIGLLPVLLVTFLVFAKSRHWLTIPFAVIALYSLLSATGSHLGLAYLNYEIPLINKIREPSRFLFLTHFAVGILVALALDRIGQIVNARRSNIPFTDKFALGAVALVLLLSPLIAAEMWPEARSHRSILISLGATAIVATLIASAWQWRQVNRAGIVGLCAFTVLAVQQQTVQLRAATISHMDYMTEKMLGLDLALKAVAKRDSNREYRVLFEGDIDKQNAAMLASFHGIRTLNAYFNPIPKKQFEELYYHVPGSKNYYAALGAKYIVCNPCATDKVIGYRQIEKVGDYWIYEGAASPRIYVSQTVAGEYRTTNEYMEKVSHLDIASMPVLVKAGVWRGAVVSPETRSKPSMLSLLATTNNSFTVVMQTSSKALLVLNEFDSGSWLARIDGKFIDTLSVNGNQVAVAVPAGTHKISISYEPRSLKLALRLFLVGLLALFIYGFWLVRLSYLDELRK